MRFVGRRRDLYENRAYASANNGAWEFDLGSTREIEITCIAMQPRRAHSVCVHFLDF